MNPLTSIPRLGVTLSNLREAQLSAESDSPFAKLGFQADRWKAYLECEVCHSLPGGKLVGAGADASGNIIGFFPDVIAASHGSLLHQQFNLRHKLATYAEKDKKANAEDRIVGCVVATHVGSKPIEGWYGPGNLTGKGNHIRALVVVYKLAKGVAKVLGDHLTSTTTQSVSIETIAKPDQIGVYRPSTGEAYAWASMPEAWALTVKATKQGLPKIGAVDGEQLWITYGKPGDTIEFRGLAMTPNPAEPTAKILAVNASTSNVQHPTSNIQVQYTQATEEGLLAIAAEAVDQVLVGREIRFATGRVGRVDAVLTEGRGILAQQVASVENPLLRIQIARGPGMIPESVVLPLEKVSDLLVP